MKKYFGLNVTAAVLLAVTALAGCTGKTVIKSGTVTSVSSGEISISAVNGAVYNYTVDEGTYIENTYGNIGETLEVRCKGEPKRKKHADIVKAMPEAKLKPASVNVIYGTVTALKDSSVSVLANDESTYTVARDEETIVHSASSLAEGAFATVAYIGSIDDKSAVAKSVIFTGNEENQAAPKPAAPDKEVKNAYEPSADTVKYVTGVCAKNTDKAVSVSVEGIEYIFAKDAASVITGDIAEGDNIRVFFRGDLTRGIQLMRAALINKQDAELTDEAFKYKTFFGNIKEVSNTSLKFTLSDGREQVVLRDEGTELKELAAGEQAEVKCIQMDDGQLMARSVN